MKTGKINQFFQKILENVCVRIMIEGLAVEK